MLKNKKKSDVEQLIEKLTPPFENNWNWGKYKKGYKKQFSAYFTAYVFPYLLKTAREQGVAINELSLLDIGCGWAPLAIPFVVFNKENNSNRKDKTQYLGIDIREDSIKWLTLAYADFPYVKFQWHQADRAADYIGAEHAGSSTVLKSDGQEANYKIPKDFFHNVQWSNSVFTHLTPQASLQALKAIKSSCSSNSVQINTWLIIDAESRYALNAENADRNLPIDRGDFLTYSNENPLVCTAYKIEAIRRLYAEAGLEIIRIEMGSWRGPAYYNAANNYQDIIISRICKE